MDPENAKLRQSLSSFTSPLTKKEVPFLVLKTITEGPSIAAAHDYIKGTAKLDEKYDFLPKDEEQRIVNAGQLHKAERVRDKAAYPLKAQEYADIIMKHKPTLHHVFVHNVSKFKTEKWIWELQLPYDIEVLKAKADKLKRWNTRQKYKRKNSRRNQASIDVTGKKKARYDMKRKAVPVPTGQSAKRPRTELTGDEHKAFAAKAKAARKKAKKERKRKEAAKAAEAAGGNSLSMGGSSGSGSSSSSSSSSSNSRSGFSVTSSSAETEKQKLDSEKAKRKADKKAKKAAQKLDQSDRDEKADKAERKAAKKAAKEAAREAAQAAQAKAAKKAKKAAKKKRKQEEAEAAAQKEKKRLKKAKKKAKKEK